MNLQKYLVLLLIGILTSCSTSKRSTTIPSSTKPVVAITDTLKSKMDNVEVVLDTIVRPIAIGLILPLQLDNHFTNDSISDVAPFIIPETVAALNFYEGALVAKDSLKNFGIDVEFKVFDCSVDSADVIKLLNNKEFKKCDFVLSMTSSSLNSLVSKAASRYEMPFIILQNSNTQILEKNSNIWLSTPSNSSQIRLMASYLYKTYPSSQFITVFRDVKRESDLSKLYSSVIDSIADSKNFCQSVEYLKGTGWTSLKSKFAKQKRNILIIPTSDESYVSSLISKLDEVKNEYTFLLSGLPAWENFEALDPDKLKEYNAHFFSGLYIDENNLRNQNFRKAFVVQYHNYPSAQVFESFDLVTYLANNFKSFKNKYSLYKSQANFESTQTGFDFIEVCPKCGLENKSISILKF